MKIHGSGLARAVVLAALLAVGGCIDAPMAPDTFQQIAGGEAWVAIPEPHGLPTLATWTPYVVRGSGATAPRARIDALIAESREAAYEGDLEWAALVEAEALKVAVRSLERVPGPGVMAAGLGSIADWVERVGAALDLRVYPEVAASLTHVERSLAMARSALEVGDTTRAVVEISTAAERIRNHAPAAVALRVLGVAESRVHERSQDAVVLDRAVHLIRSARHELIDGEATTALRRALYALQLSEEGV